jgi:hypothetical protein
MFSAELKGDADDSETIAVERVIADVLKTAERIKN